MAQIFTSIEVKEMLEVEFKTFHKNHHGILTSGDLQTLAMFIKQVGEELDEPTYNLASKKSNI